MNAIACWQQAKQEFESRRNQIVVELSPEEEAQRREEEEKRKQEEEVRQRVEKERKQKIMQERTSRKECASCGKPLKFLDRLLGRTTHHGCHSFQE
ncbi:MAG: hypothetical protein MOB07_05255 [Acidobacteria bacterium]|nr:hypothetical protein [Acidobacteriota bacterium]